MRGVGVSLTTWPAVDQSDAPEGYEWRWEPVRDNTGYCGDWRVVPADESKPCRYTVGPDKRTCKLPSAAKLDRGRDRRNWWHYCENHLYGRMLVDGVIYSKVLRPLDGDA